MDKKYRLSGQVAIVTASAGAGIGQATARRLAEEGAQVVVSDAHERRTQEVAARLKEDGFSVIGVPCDVSKREQVENMVAQTIAAFGRIDILVNNAARELTAPIVDMTDEIWDMVMNVCLKGTFYCTRAVLPTMMKQKSGCIINLASVLAWVGSTNGEAAYCAAKNGIIGFTKIAALETAKYGVRVNAVSPGLISNPYLEKIYNKEAMDEFRRKSPFNRVGQPEEMAGIIAFLASSDASFITGETINATGGWYLGP